MPDRIEILEDICKQAGRLALKYFREQDTLVIDHKGHQDFVSQADRNVELLTRDLLAKAFPEDAIVGEEHAPTPGTSGLSLRVFAALKPNAGSSTIRQTTKRLSL